MMNTNTVPYRPADNPDAQMQKHKSVEQVKIVTSIERPDGTKLSETYSQYCPDFIIMLSELQNYV